MATPSVGYGDDDHDNSTSGEQSTGSSEVQNAGTGRRPQQQQRQSLVLESHEKKKLNHLLSAVPKIYSNSRIVA